MEQSQFKFPEVLYKYRDWNNNYHKEVLTKNALYLSSPKLFNDPFDCKVSRNLSLLDTDQKINDFVEMTSKLADRHDLQEEFINRKKRELFERLKYRMEDMQAEENEIEFRHQDEDGGVLSLSMRWDSILMWSHYSNNHKGFCVGFNGDRLGDLNAFGKAGKVIYDDFPLIDPLSNDHFELFFKGTHSKAKDWEYEEEFRFSKIFYGEQKNDSRTIYITDDCLKEIIVGLETSEDHKEELKVIAKKKGIKIYQAKKIPFSFTLDREEIVL